MDQARSPSDRMRSDVITIFVVFALNGVMIGNWISRIPAIKEHLAVHLDLLGWLFLCMGLGSLLSMPFTGHVIARIGVRTTHLICAIGSAIALTTASAVSHPIAFGGLYALAGMFWGAWDVTINVQGAEVEAASGQTIMPSLHGAWGGGMLVGSLIGMGATRLNVSLAVHIVSVLPVVALLALVASLRWQEYRKPAAHADEGGRVPRAMVLATVVIGLMMLCSTIGEGSASDWLALHMVEDRGASQFIGSSMYTVYALFLTVGRLAGHLLINGLGRVNAIRISGVSTFLGCLAVILAPNLAVSYLGAALWGLGLAAVFPVGISAAGERGGRHASHTISWASTMAYGGFLIGPPLLGMVGHAFTLRNAFWITAALAIGTVLLAPIARPLAGVADAVGDH